MTPTHEIDVTEFEAGQLLIPLQWGQEWRTIYLDDRSTDPTFKAEFSTLMQKCLNFVYRGDIIVTAKVMDAITPEEQCRACGMDPSEDNAPYRYRLDLDIAEAPYLIHPQHRHVLHDLRTHSTKPHDILEKVLIEKWQEEQGGGDLLQLLCRDLEAPQLINNRERRIAATVIQWLGSNCGLSFLHEVNKCTDGLLTKRIQ